MEHKFLVHGTGDTVGVAVQDIVAGETVTGVFLDTDKEVRLTANYAIKLGHKIALESVKRGEFVHEYGEVIGKATENIKPGDLVHIHNIKSARW